MSVSKDKYARIRKQMVANFVIWILFVFTEAIIVSIGVWKFGSAGKISVPFESLLLIMALCILSAHYLPTFLINKAPFNYHNDAGRMSAFRVKFGLTIILLLLGLISGVLMAIQYELTFSGYLLLFFIFAKSYKLRPRASVWIDFRMRYRAGRTMPVRNRM